MRKLQFVLSILFIASMIISACGAKAPAAIVKVGWADDPDSLNPGIATLSEAFTIFNLVYDALYQLNLDGTYSLRLAESVHVSEDRKVWTFNIHDGVKFHDGQPLTAEDVAFSFNLYSEHSEDFVYLPGYTTFFESVVATPESQVIITLTHAIPNMESQLFGLSVLPKHIWEGLEGQEAVDFKNDEMIGSGPFRLAEYQPGKFIRLETVKDHYLYHPNIGGVEFRIYKDVSDRIQALENKELDLIAEMPNSAVAALRDLPGIQVVSASPVAPNVADVIMNQSSPESCPTDAGGLCTGHPALRDRNVRLALAYATDKQKIIDDVILGLADPGMTLIPKALTSFYNSSIKDFQYDVEKANQILDTAGYLDRNNDGVREMPDGGRELTFRLEWPDDLSFGEGEAELLKVMWGQIGIDVVLQAVDSGELTSRCCPAYDYDILLWEWGSDPDPNFLLSVMLTSEIPTGYNETGYSNPVYDKLFDQQATEMDKERRQGLIWRMQDIVHKDVVYIIPFYQSEVQAYRTDTFRGWLVENGNLDLDDLTSLVVIEPIAQQ